MFWLFFCYQLKKLIYQYRKPKLVMIGLLHVTFCFTATQVLR